jgi:hypothetical protein
MAVIPVRPNPYDGTPDRLLMSAYVTLVRAHNAYTAALTAYDQALALVQAQDKETDHAHD